MSEEKKRSAFIARAKERSQRKPSIVEKLLVSVIDHARAEHAIDGVSLLTEQAGKADSSSPMGAPVYPALAWYFKQTMRLAAGDAGEVSALFGTIASRMSFLGSIFVNEDPEKKGR